MNRQQKREIDRKKQKLNKAVEKLTPDQLELIDILAENKVKQALEVYKEKIKEATVKAMRKNKISLERANRVIKEANKDVEGNI